MLKEKTNYKVKDYNNLWSIIDTLGDFCLLENNTYGDETCYLVTRLDQEPVMLPYKKRDSSFIELPTILGTVYETFDGIETCLEDEGLI